MQRDLYRYENVIFLEGQVVNPREKNPVIKNEEAIIHIWWIVASFFMGRVVLLDELSPFGVALYAALMGSSINPVVYLISISIGVLTRAFNTEGILYIGGLSMLYIYEQVIYSRTRRLDRYTRALMASIAVLTINLIGMYSKGFIVYNILIAISESIIAFIMTYIFRHTTEAFSSRKKRRIFSNEEIICTSIFLSLIIVGFWDGGRLPISLRNTFSIYIILISAYIGGAGVGASIGITVGFILSLAGISDVILIGCLGICGLMAGTFKDLGKPISGASFIITNALATFYVNKSTDVIIPLIDILGGGLLLMLTPQSIIAYISQFFDASITRSKDQIFYIRRMQDMISSRLKEFSNVFYHLSKTFNRVSNGVENGVDSNEVSKLIEGVVDQVCTDCSLYKRCWEMEFYRTYNSIFQLIESLEGDEVLNREEVKAFKMRCYKFNTIKEKSKSLYLQYRENLRWNRQLEECRYLVADQLMGVSGVIDGLATEIDIDVHFKREIEDKINIELDKRGVYCKDVLVMEKSTGKLEVSIIKEACRGKRECSKVVEGVVSTILGRSFSCKNRDCIYAGRDKCSIYLEEAKKFNVMTGLAHMTKESKDITGDSHASMALRDGKFMLALSDGMGSGNRAATESRDVISLLENFMEAGFDLDVTVKTINSVLIMRSEDEIFATADICLIDQISGRAEFAKIGAVSTFIRRRNTVEVVQASSLPIGIIQNIEMDRAEVDLLENDMLIMVTDGVLDAYEGNLDADSWLSGIIGMEDTKNPQKMAEYILHNALKAGGGRAKDDMTVMVSRIWRPK